MTRTFASILATAMLAMVLLSGCGRSEPEKKAEQPTPAAKQEMKQEATPQATPAATPQATPQVTPQATPQAAPPAAPEAGATGTKPVEGVGATTGAK